MAPWISPAAQMNMCTLHDDGEIVFKASAAVLSGITSCVANNPVSEKLIVTRIVCLSVDPQCRLISFNHTLQPARECRVQGIVRVARRDGFQRRQMMRNDDCRAIERLLELAH